MAASKTKEFTNSIIDFTKGNVKESPFKLQLLSIKNTTNNVYSGFKRIIPFSDNLNLNFLKNNQTHETRHTHCNCFITRHDHHNIEFKSIIEVKNASIESELELFLFIPKTFAVKQEEKSTLQKDFRSRLRLAVPLTEFEGTEALKNTLQEMKLSIDSYLRPNILDSENSEKNEATQVDELMNTARQLSAIIAENFKKSASELPRQFFLSFNLINNVESCCQTIDELTKTLRAKAEMMQEVRSVICTESPIYVLKLLNEFLSYTYIQYLAKVETEVDSATPSEDVKNNFLYQRSIQTLRDCMSEMQEKESAHRYRVGLKIGSEETEAARESRLMRLSQLKKFFQSTSFIEFSQKNTLKHLYETLATLGTACAGLAVALLENFKNSSNAQITFGGIFIISFGVFAYVLRDRLKDWAKSALNKKVSEYVPDSESNLYAQNKKMGYVKEWLRVVPSKSLPFPILNSRNRVAESELEKVLPEDVILYKKAQGILSKHHSVKNESGIHAVHENIRINLERYLKHMDDPFKDLAELDAWGKIIRSQAHRVYHFYLCARIKFRSVDDNKFDFKLSSQSKFSNEQLLMTKIVMDKSGVVRLESSQSPKLSSNYTRTEID